MEWVILKMLPKIMAGGIFTPIFLSLFVRLYSFERPAAEVAKLTISIDILSISLFFAVLSGVVFSAIACIIVVLMKGPAYIADAYDVDDADQPDPENKNKSRH